MSGRVKFSVLPSRSRRLAFILALLAVIVLHAWFASALEALRADWGKVAAMPERLQVAYVREMVLADPLPPGIVAPPAAAKRVPAAASEPASAPEQAAPEPELVAEAAADANEPVAPLAQPIGAELASSAPSEAAADYSAQPAPAAVASAASAPFEWPASTRLAYVLTGNYRGEVHGSAQVEWIRQGAHYQVNLDVAVGPPFMPLISRRMTSDGMLGEQGLRPLRYDEDTRILFRDRRRVSVLMRDSEVVLANGSSVRAESGVQDTASQFVQLTWLFLTQRERLEAGHVIAMPLALPRRVRAWRYEVIGEELLNTPMGPLETWHLRPQQEAGQGDLTAEVWIAPQLQYLPVRLRIHQDAENFIDLMLKAAPLQAAPE